jgi:dTDP-4-amino-4,6-dideoxygalactose transaminase
MLLLDDEKIYERCKFLRDHGRAPGTYFNTEVTFKYMPFNVQAALGYAQFQRIDELVGKKRWIWKGYCYRLSEWRLDYRFSLRQNSWNDTRSSTYWSSQVRSSR